MSTTRSEQDQATQPVQSDQYQPLGRQEAPTNPDALYGGNADDNSGSGGNAHPTEHPKSEKTAAEDESDSAIPGPGVSGGTGVSGGSIGQVNL